MPTLSSNPRLPVNALDILLKQCYASLTCRRHALRRQYVTGSSTSNINHEATDIAVLGGGITGLASAYYLSSSLPHAKITLFEASARLGGWLHSQSVDVGTGNVVFEQGPRNLRPSNPNGLITLDLVRDLGLEDRVLMTSKNSVAAQNRFIYYPDHLVRMPGPGISLLSNLINLLSEPIFKGAISAAFFDFLKLRPKRPEGLEDESLGSFISRRFGSALADNVVSAVIHGIYGGDIYKLSARTILPGLWHRESARGTVLGGHLQKATRLRVPVADDDVELIKDFNSRPVMSDTLEAVKKSSVFTFKGGIGELADRLERKLLESPNVQIHQQMRVNRVKPQQDEEGPMVRISTEDISTRVSRESDFTHILSTVSGSTSARMVNLGDKDVFLQYPNSLAKAFPITIMVVNLFFSNPAILPVHGFGYLLPRTVLYEQNPERALGVVFDSDATIGQDAVPGTKVTVMLGGHWWHRWDTYPDEDEGAAMAKRILNRHLGISEEPRAIRVSLHRDCIPQYPVGHEMNMEKAHDQLERFQGRFRVAGNSYTGVGLNDCVRAARDAVKGLVDGTGKTGLESFVGGKKYSWLHAEDLNWKRRGTSTSAR